MSVRMKGSRWNTNEYIIKKRKEIKTEQNKKIMNKLKVEWKEDNKERKEIKTERQNKRKKNIFKKWKQKWKGRVRIRHKKMEKGQKKLNKVQTSKINKEKELKQ